MVSLRICRAGRARAPRQASAIRKGESHPGRPLKAPQLTLSSTQATSIRSIRSLVPLLDRVLVQRVKAETKTASGIFLPESSVKELNEGRVLAVGPGAVDRDGKRVPMGVASGDRVLIPQVCLRCSTRGKVDANTIHSSVVLPSRSARRSTLCTGTASKSTPLTTHPLPHY
jgi:chaperonin GroES